MKTQAAARPPLTTTLLWLGLAITAGATGVFTRVPSPGPQLLILALSAATIVAGFRAASLRAWLEQLDLRLLVLPHVGRLPVGAAFLVLASQGRMSELFARNAGWGDIIAGAAALGVLSLGALATPLKRRALLAWNVIGLADFVLVLGTAAVVALREPGALRLLFTLPGILVPLFAVPLLIASHVFVFWRLARRPGA